MKKLLVSFLIIAIGYSVIGYGYYRSKTDSSPLTKDSVEPLMFSKTGTGESGVATITTQDGEIYHLKSP